MGAAEELPIEIWRQIYEHVRSSDRVRLYEVNRALYQIFMNEKYEHVECGRMSCRRELEVQLDMLRSSTTSKYIKQLTIRIGPLPRLLESDLLDPLSVSIAQKLRRTFSPAPRLPTLHTLTIIAPEEKRHYLEYPQFRKHYTVGARYAMDSIGSSLLALNLSHVPLEFYRDDTIPNTLTFPLLEVLCLDVSTIYETTVYETILELTIAPFINRHSQSLKKLGLASRDLHPRPTYYYKYGSLFRYLTHIPNLTDLSLRFFLILSDEKSLHELTRFVGAHTTTLQHLQLYLYHSALDIHPPAGDPTLAQLELKSIARLHTPETLFAHPLFSQVLSSCRTLKVLHCVVLSEDSLQNDPAPFLSWLPSLQCARTLTSLSLPYNTLNQADLITLVSSVDLSSLRRMRVKVQAFDMTLFDAFATNLPSLEALTINAYALFCTLADGSKVEWTPASKLLEYSPFLVQVRSRSYPDWSTLRELSTLIIDKEYNRRRCQFGCCVWNGGPTMWITEEQVRSTFPYLQHFEGEIRPFVI
ncbi:hypothetical protein NMY22_g7705 [Coprinellus aureogranulatus]|nr:hypothetical protein NMY22_g7705 [Coprinellus aureogranulatus]